MSLLTKIFGSYSQHQIKKLKRIANKVDALSDVYKQMSDDEMREKTEEFKSRIAGGESLDSILPEAFALVREADWRVGGTRPVYVQILGGSILHQGRIA